MCLSGNTDTVVHMLSASLMCLIRKQLTLLLLYNCGLCVCHQRLAIASTRHFEVLDYLANMTTDVLDDQLLLNHLRT